MGLPGFLGALNRSTEVSRSKKPRVLVRMSLQAKPLGLGSNQVTFFSREMVFLVDAVQVRAFDGLE